MIISTGSQGEPLSALSRMANREHPVIELEPGDTVVLASSLIPGNENSVYRVINGLSRLGRPGRAQGQRAGPRLRPRQRRRAALLLQHRPAAQRDARARRGAPPGRQRRARRSRPGCRASGRSWPRTARSSTSSRAGPGSSARSTPATSSSTARTVGDISEAALTDRRILGEEGFISVVTVVNTHASKIISGPDIHARGFVEDDARLRPGPTADRRRSRGRRWPTASTTPTSCSRSSAAGSAAGSTTPTAAAR